MKKVLMSARVPKIIKELITNDSIENLRSRSSYFVYVCNWWLELSDDVKESYIKEYKEELKTVFKIKKDDSINLSVTADIKEKIDVKDVPVIFMIANYKGI